MRRLQQLLQARIVFADDTLYFTFKKHIFTGKVAQGGLIWQCTWQKPGEMPSDIFKHTVGLGQQPYAKDIRISNRLDRNMHTRMLR